MVSKYAKITLRIKEALAETDDPRVVLSELVEGIEQLEDLDSLEDLELLSWKGKDHPLYGDREYCLDLKYEGRAANEDFYALPRKWLTEKCGFYQYNFSERVKYVNKGYSDECKQIGLRFLGNRIQLILKLRNPFWRMAPVADKRERERAKVAPSQ